MFSDKLMELKDIRNGALLDERNGFLSLQRGRAKRILRKYRRHLVTTKQINQDLARQKRAVAASIAVLASIVSLLTSLGSSVYFGVQIHSLNNYIEDLDKQLESDAKLADKIGSNVKILRKGEEVMAIRVDTIYESLNRLAKTDACRMTNAFYLNELGIMENFYHELYKLISSHRVDVSLLPLSALSKLIESSSILQNSLISTFPTSFYEVSRLSLLSVQKRERRMKVLLTFPNVEKTARYVQIAFHSPPVSLIAEDGTITSVSLNLNINPVALPIEVFRRDTFDVLNFTVADIDAMVELFDCSEMSGIPYCKSVAPLEDRQKNCLKGIVLRDKILEKSCHVQKTNEIEKRGFTYSVGSSGITIAAHNNFIVYSYENGQIGSILAQGSNVNSKFAQCLFVPSLFPEVLIKNSANQEFYLTQNTKMRLQTSVGQHREFFTVNRHLAWYNFSSENWTNNGIGNMTDAIRDMHLLDMKRQLVHIRRVSTGFSWVTILVFVLLGWSALLTVAFVCMIKRGCIRCSGNNQENQTDTSNSDPAAVAAATAALMQAANIRQQTLETQNRLIQAQIMQGDIIEEDVVPKRNLWERVSNRLRRRGDIQEGMTLDKIKRQTTVSSNPILSAEDFDLPLRGPLREANVGETAM